MAKQVELELARRLHSEQSLLQVKGILEERMAERISELENVNQGFVLNSATGTGSGRTQRS